MGRLWASISIIGVFLLFIVAGIANATTIDFGDSVKYWPGWGNSSGDDSNDTIGTPKLSGGSVTIEDSLLKSVTIKYNNTCSLVGPGDLFIDIGGNQYWDYVVDTDATGNNIYSFGSAQFALGDNYYDLSDTTWTHSGYIRNNHPVLYNEGIGVAPSGTASIGNDFSTGANLTFTYSNLELPLASLNGESSFIIGWTVSCANDVIYETVSTPLPAPTTILLVGSGLLGLVAFVRKRRTP